MLPMHWILRCGSFTLTFTIMNLQCQLWCAFLEKLSPSRATRWKIFSITHTERYADRHLFSLFRALKILQLIDTEVKRKIKKEPALAVELRKDLFPESDAPEMDAGVSGRDAVSELWVFA